MKTDYHMHLEYGSYNEDWAEGFFDAARARGLSEVGFSEHSHTFPEFKDLYYETLILDDSFIGKFQKEWLQRNKFKYTIDEYFEFMHRLQKRHNVKIGMEVCNLKDQKRVGEILGEYKFDYLIGSIHFISGWAYDSSEIKSEWKRRDLREVYEAYTQEIERMADTGLYDVLGHPFNLRLYKFIPDFDVTPYLERAVKALKKARMGIDINTGTFYRYPIKEISPFPAFMRIASRNDLPVIITSDAHKPEHCGAYHEDAAAYARYFGVRQTIHFDGRKRQMIPLA